MRGAMEGLEEELTCPICCSLFEDPRVLLCSHSFCKKCLEALVEGSRGVVFRNPLKCPTCRKETPHNGANSLQINYSLRGIVEKYSKLKVLPKTSVCKQHCGHPLNIFCATDSKLICGICATSGNHRGHKFSSLEDAYEQEKGAFEEMLRGAESWQSADILSCLQSLQANKKKALQSVTADAGKVAEYFDKLIGALECKKSEMLSDFETLKLVVMQAYDPQIDRLSAALEEQSRALALAESFKSVTKPLCFLQQMQEFREKLEVLKQTPLPSRKDINIDPCVRNFDVRKWDSLRLSEVDKISVPHESGSYRTGGSRMPGVRRIVFCLTLLLLLLPLILQPLMPHSFGAGVTSTFDPFMKALVSQTSAFLQKMTDLCKRFMDADQEYIYWPTFWQLKHVQTCHLLRAGFLTRS
uniref:Tripartite motif containing 13 n=1 Tax=Oryzias melastigma TaxID=30732 RepID=A0A3B3DHS8_ORYME